MNRRQFVSAALTLPLTLPLCVTLGGCTTEAPYRGPTVIGEWIDAKPLQPEETIVFNFYLMARPKPLKAHLGRLNIGRSRLNTRSRSLGRTSKTGFVSLIRRPTTYVNSRSTRCFLSKTENSCVLFVRNQVTQSHSRQRDLSAHLPDRDAFWRASRPCRAT